jgi:hypothetical protein
MVILLPLTLKDAENEPKSRAHPLADNKLTKQLLELVNQATYYK